MKIIVAPDKFKGSLTSMQVCKHIKYGIESVGKTPDVKLFPMADGGDGFAAVMKYYLHTQTTRVKTVDPVNRDIVAAYEWDAGNKTAIIELAAASGINLLKKEEQNPLYTSSFGTGLLVKHAVDNGAQKIILGLGGSATTDAGTGILAALGFEFRDADDSLIEPAGGNLCRIQKITCPEPLVPIVFTVAADVSNVLFGKDGAAFVYAPQKGADKKSVRALDEGLQHFASIIRSVTGKEVAGFKGSGAAGGVAAGLAAFFETQVVSGAGLVIETAGLNEHMAGCDLVITGEGRLDEQTFNGKVVHQVAVLANRHNIPVVAICGNVSINEKDIAGLGLAKAVSLVSETVTAANAQKKAAALVEMAAASVLKK